MEADRQIRNRDGFYPTNTKGCYRITNGGCPIPYITAFRLGFGIPLVLLSIGYLRWLKKEGPNLRKELREKK
ncbi:hypothetical protein HYT25_04810 [Candidatus Pacearchaeota archaeon]|nr:hypothetical protein [Candidatus Pacearchaeota archaeon]